MLFFLVVGLLSLYWPQQAADIAHLKANFARRFSCNRGHAAFPRAISESGDNGVRPSPSISTLSLHQSPEVKFRLAFFGFISCVFLAVCGQIWQKFNKHFRQ